MKKDEQEHYLEKYSEDKKKGIPFFPDAVFKDTVVALIVFVAVVSLAWFLGASLEEIADPGDSNYTPRPEWYFLFLFQLLKFFPGSLEVLGVFIIPMMALGFLVALPWTDRSARRHWSGRPVVTTITGLLLAGATFLTAQAITATPPQAVATALGDQTAKIYAANCAGCHGSSIAIEPGVDLFQVIQGGTHEGMPAWNSDLAASEIDAVVGFILAPNGYALYVDNCAECHESRSLIEADAIELRRALEEGPDYEPHAELGLPVWSQALSSGDQAKLLNFLTAPDGQRLWTQECASCHGQSVAFAGDRGALEDIIRLGGGHLEMPAFEEAIDPAGISRMPHPKAPPSSACIAPSVTPPASPGQPTSRRQERRSRWAGPTRTCRCGERSSPMSRSTPSSNTSSRRQNSRIWAKPSACSYRTAPPVTGTWARAAPTPVGAVTSSLRSRPPSISPPETTPPCERSSPRGNPTSGCHRLPIPSADR